jgi:death-on-curing protein
LGDALEAHEAAIKFGGVAGVLNLHLVQSAIARPYIGYYRSMAKKGAALVESLCRNRLCGRQQEDQSPVVDAASG